MGVLLGVVLGVFDRKVLCNGSYFREKSPLGVVSALDANGDARTVVTGGVVRVGIGTGCLTSGLLGLARFTRGATASAGAVLRPFSWKVLWSGSYFFEKSLLGEVLLILRWFGYIGTPAGSRFPQPVYLGRCECAPNTLDLPWPPSPFSDDLPCPSTNFSLRRRPSL